MVDLSAHVTRIDAILADRGEIYSDPQSDFISFLREQGYKPPDILRIGPPFMKFPCPVDKGNKKKGFCIYHELPDDNHSGRSIGIGIYGNYYDGLEPKKWISRQFNSLSLSQRAALEEKIADHQRQYEVEKENSQKEAAATAKEIYSAGKEVLEHPYLVRKQVHAYEAVKIATTSLENERPGDLMIPVINDKDQLMSIEFIKPDGEKRFMTGGKKQGCFFKISGRDESVIYICEGYSTAASVFAATSRTTYISFDCNNLYNVASHVKKNHPKARIVIAGDDDIDKEINAGRKAAEQAAHTLGIECMFPVLMRGAGKDWNDLACSQGAKEVKRQLEYLPAVYKAKEEILENEFELEPPAGMLRDVYNYFNMTAGQNQRGFAVQTALAVVSVLTARNFITKPHNNLTSLYLLCIGKSSTGKEHTRTIIETVLNETNHPELQGKSGHTSAAGVLSGLLYRPRHINIIDEFGRNLEAARKSGDTLIVGANTKLMEAFGQLNGQMLPMEYSSLNLPKAKQDEMKNQKFVCPGITLFAMTVPSRFYNALDIESVQDGYLGRFLICESEAKRTVWMPQDSPEFPEAIRDWVKNIYERIGNKPESYNERPDQIHIKVDTGAEKLRIKYATECNEIGDELEQFGLAELSGKAGEIMMRVALCAAISRDPYTQTIKEEDARWAYKYVKSCFERTFAVVKNSVSGSLFESTKKEALNAFRVRGEKGYTDVEMQKLKPFSVWRLKDLEDIIKALVRAELIASKQEERKGKMSLVYYAI